MIHSKPHAFDTYISVHIYNVIRITDYVYHVSNTVFIKSHILPYVLKGYK